MKDFTSGPMRPQIVAMAVPIAIGMAAQTLYLLVDLVFVGRLGGAALAGVGAAGNLMLLVMALTQMLGVGTVALMARAVGAGERDGARLIFNQGLLMGALGATLTLVAGYALAPAYLRALGADSATMDMGLAYLHAFLPGLALQFAGNALASGLRATGVVKPAMLMQLVAVLVNALLAPALIAGWGGGPALGVAGAGWASTLSIGLGVGLLLWYCLRQRAAQPQSVLGLRRELMRPRWPLWGRVLGLGFPAGAEFACMFLFTAVVYAAISQFGAAAMAGFGIGARIMQAIFLPGMAIAFALPAIAGQNLGAGAIGRVGQTIRQGLMLEGAAMLLLTVACRWRPASLVAWFASDPASAAVAATYLRIVSLNLVCAGVVFACSAMFQALGNSWPGLISTASRLLLFALPALWLAGRPGFQIEQLWVLSVLTVVLQAGFSLLLLRRQWLRLSEPQPTRQVGVRPHGV